MNERDRELWSEYLKALRESNGWYSSETNQETPTIPVNPYTGLSKLNDSKDINIKIDNQPLTKEEIKEAVKEGVVEGLNEFIEELKNKGASGLYGGGFLI